MNQPCRRRAIYALRAKEQQAADLIVGVPVEQSANSMAKSYVISVDKPIKKIKGKKK